MFYICYSNITIVEKLIILDFGSIERTTTFLEYSDVSPLCISLALSNGTIICHLINGWGES